MQLKIQNFEPNLIKPIYQLDKTYYGTTVKPSWYCRYVNKAKIVLCLENNKIVGYLIIANISKKLFCNITNLKFSGDINFNSADFLTKSHYCYLPSILILKQFRQPNLPLIMINMALKHIKNKKICAICVSNEGTSMAKRFLNFVGNVSNSQVYSN